MDPALQEQLLQQLKDIDSPQAISWWPLAPGWWILIILSLIALAAAAYFVYATYRANDYRREALKLAEQAQARFTTNQDSAQYLNTINTVLKQTSLHLTQADPSANIAHASGTQWIEFLTTRSSRALSANTIAALRDGIYRPATHINVADIHRDVTGWIKSHSKKKLDDAAIEKEHEAANA